MARLDSPTPPPKPDPRTDVGREPDEEAQLLARHARGDTDAFVELVGRFRAPVYGYLVRCGVPSEQRDDLFQEIFMKVHASADRFDPTRSAKAWIFTIAANTARSHHRAQTRGLHLVPAGTDDVDAEPDATATSPLPSSQEWAEAHQTADALEQSLARLPRTQREVLVLCCIEQLPQQDVAAALDLPVNTVKTHLRRARLALAQTLARQKLIARRT